jgi:hypothetical protein
VEAGVIKCYDINNISNVTELTDLIKDYFKTHTIIGEEKAPDYKD